MAVQVMAGLDLGVVHVTLHWGFTVHLFFLLGLLPARRKNDLYVILIIAG